MIHARGLVQTFHTGRGKNQKEVTAVDGVDLDVREGEVVGFLGPNGAGKTTTLRMLTTLLKPTGGTATVAGYDVVRESVEVRRSIGYVSQVGSTFSGAFAGDEVVGREGRELLAGHGVPSVARQCRTSEVVERLACSAQSVCIARRRSEGAVGPSSSDGNAAKCVRWVREAHQNL